MKTYYFHSIADRGRPETRRIARGCVGDGRIAAAEEPEDANRAAAHATDDGFLPDFLGAVSELGDIVTFSVTYDPDTLGPAMIEVVQVPEPARAGLVLAALGAIAALRSRSARGRLRS